MFIVLDSFCTYTLECDGELPDIYPFKSRVTFVLKFHFAPISQFNEINCADGFVPIYTRNAKNILMVVCLLGDG